MSELTIQRRRSGAISGSERITGVKNAQADVLLNRKKQHYEVVLKKTEQDIQLEEHKLENENKLLNLENKRNELEYKKRLYPSADHSNDEMTVKQLEKYLVRNANKLFYTDKSLQTKVRNNCSTDVVPPVVAQARSTLVRKEIIRAVEKNRQHMYKFLDKPVSRQQKREQHQHDLYASAPDIHQHHDDEDEFEIAVRENKLPTFAGQLMPQGHYQTGKTPPEKPEPQQQNKGKQFLSLPAVPEHPIRKSAKQRQQPKVLEVPAHIRVEEYEKRELHARLKRNPLIKEALEAHEKEKSTLDPTKSRQSVAGVLARMAKKKPPTRTEIQAELEQVQYQVGAFCERIEKIIWTYKEEEFQQGLKFVKDKDTEWNKFMETMQTRKQTGKPERAESEDEGEDEEREEKPVIDKRKQRPKTSALTDMPPLSDKQREKILMKNLLLSKPRLVESAPPARKRGVPRHAELRSQHHSPTAKLQRMLEKNKNILEAVSKVGQPETAPDPAAAQLTVATKMAAANAK